MLNGYGVPIYIDRSERVTFDIGVSYSKSRAAMERAEEMEQKKNGGVKSYGKSFYPIPKTKDGGPLPTLAEFMGEQEKRAEMMKNFKRAPTPFSNEGWTADNP